MFIIYIIGTLLGLLSYFSKNYFLGLSKALFKLLESVLYDFTLLCYEVRLGLLLIYDKTKVVINSIINK